MEAFRPPARRPDAADRASAARVADAAVAAWTSIHDGLAPVVGARGAAALYRRTLFLAAESHRWLAPAYAGAVEPGDFASLRIALASQEAASAADAQQRMLAALHDLLVRLIGPSLTHRLLPAVWAPPQAGDAVRDISP